MSTSQHLPLEVPPGTPNLEPVGETGDTLRIPDMSIRPEPLVAIGDLPDTPSQADAALQDQVRSLEAAVLGRTDEQIALGLSAVAAETTRRAETGRRKLGWKGRAAALAIGAVGVGLSAAPAAASEDSTASVANPNTASHVATVDVDDSWAGPIVVDAVRDAAKTVTQTTQSQEEPSALQSVASEAATAQASSPAEEQTEPLEVYNPDESQSRTGFEQGTVTDEVADFAMDHMGFSRELLDAIENDDTHQLGIMVNKVLAHNHLTQAEAAQLPPGTQLNIPADVIQDLDAIYRWTHGGESPPAPAAEATTENESTAENEGFVELDTEDEEVAALQQEAQDVLDELHVTDADREEINEAVDSVVDSLNDEELDTLYAGTNVPPPSAEAVRSLRDLPVPLDLAASVGAPEGQAVIDSAFFQHYEQLVRSHAEDLTNLLDEDDHEGSRSNMEAAKDNWTRILGALLVLGGAVFVWRRRK